MGKSESQMDIMEKSTKPRKHRWTVVEIGLSVIVLLMSCALAGLIVLYTSALRGGNASHSCAKHSKQTCSRSLLEISRVHLFIAHVEQLGETFLLKNFLEKQNEKKSLNY